MHRDHPTLESSHRSTFEVIVIETASLGDRSYIAHDGRIAVVIDPQRDIDRIDAELTKRAPELALILETQFSITFAERFPSPSPALTPWLLARTIGSVGCSW